MIREMLKSRNDLTLIVKLTTKQSIIIMCVNHRITKSFFVCLAKSTKMLYEMLLGNMKKRFNKKLRSLKSANPK